MDDELPIYELKRRAGSVYQLSGGRLTEAIVYPDDDEAIGSVKPMIGFLAQLTGAELRIFDENEKPIETKIYRPGVRPSEKELGNP